MKSLFTFIIWFPKFGTEFVNYSLTIVFYSPLVVTPEESRPHNIAAYVLIISLCSKIEKKIIKESNDVE